MPTFLPDAISSLAAATAGTFPQYEIRTGTVHTQRNALEHLGKQDFSIFRSRQQGVRSTWSPGSAVE